MRGSHKADRQEQAASSVIVSFSPCNRHIDDNDDNGDGGGGDDDDDSDRLISACIDDNLGGNDDDDDDSDSLLSACNLQIDDNREYDLVW